MGIRMGSMGSYMVVPEVGTCSIMIPICSAYDAMYDQIFYKFAHVASCVFQREGVGRRASSLRFLQQSR